MPKAFSRLFYHFVWATKNRRPAISEDSKPALLETIAGKCHDLGAEVRALNAVSDHVHLLARLPPTTAPSHFIRHVKGRASFAANRSEKDESLYWQKGYGVLTLSSGDLKRVAAYIENQERRHVSKDLWHSLERVDEENGSPTTARDAPN